LGWLKSYWVELVLVGVLAVAVGFFGYLGYGLVTAQTESERYSGEEALRAVSKQMEFGPRIMGTPPNALVKDWLIAELQSAGWYPVLQEFYVPATVDDMLPTTVFTSTVTSNSTSDFPATSTSTITSAATSSVTSTVPADSASDMTTDLTAVTGNNIIAISTSITDTNQPVGWLVTRYDTRLWADADPDPANQQLPVPGANGGASGPALLVQLAHTVNRSATGHRICLVLLDGEANRGLPGWSEMAGIDYYLQGLTDQLSPCNDPRFAVMLDFVGGENQQIRMTQNSDPSLSSAIWRFAAELEHDDVLLDEQKGEISGAHEALIASGIPTVALIDADYPYRATTEDTVDKLSAESFTSIGETLTVWLEAQAPFSP
jgi:hypothetical protein